MRLTRIVAHDFEGYEDLDLDLSGIGSVVVVGKNGAGKSGLLDAVTWCLFDEIGRDITSKDLVIRDGTDAAEVRVEFTTSDGHEVSVLREKQRGRTGTLTLEVNGAPQTRHTLAETKAEIERLVGLPLAALMAGPVMAQETAAAFMKARPADRKDLLARLFGLERYEGYYRAAVDQGKAATAQLTLIDQTTAAAAEKVKGEEIARATLEYEQTQLRTHTEAQSAANARVVAAKEQIAAASVQSERYDSLTRQRMNLMGRISANEGEQQALGVRLREAQVLIDRALPSINLDEIRAAEDEVNASRDAQLARSRLEGELRAALTQESDRRTARARLAGVPCHAEGIYASCQFLVGAPTEAELAESTAVVAEIRSRLDAMPSPDVRQVSDRLMAMRAGMEARRSEEVAQARAVATLDEGGRNAAALREAHTAMSAELDRVGAELADVEAAGRALGALREQLAIAEREHELARAAATQHFANVRRLEADLAAIEQAKRELAEWADKRGDLERTRDSLRLLAQAFHRDGIPTRILAGGIPLIEAEANRVLATLPGDLSIALRTERAKATGGMTDTLDVVVTVNGWEREYGLLSVGQRFRIDLALRLGLSRVLTHRSGATIDTLWLDEPLAALDVEGREAVMETLAVLEDQFGLIVVVSHHPDFNDRFGARVEVVQTDGISTARLEAA